MTTQQASTEIDEISISQIIFKLVDFFIFLKINFRKIIIAGIIGSIIGLCFSFFEKPIYVAELTFAMDDDKASGNTGLSGAIGLASSFGIDLGSTSGGGAFAASNLSELMKSRLIVEKVLLSPIQVNNTQKTLLEFYIEINNLKDLNKNNINFPLNLDRSQFSRKQDSILFQVYKIVTNKNNLVISQKDKKITILSIVVKSVNEKFSKYFCESLAKETTDFYIETKSKKAKTNVEVLQKQVDSIRKELNLAITGVAIEADNVYNLNPSLNVKSVSSRKKQIDVQANTTILTNLVVQLELAKINLRKETPLIQLIDKPIFPLEQNNLGKAKSTTIGFTLTFVMMILYLIIEKIRKKLFN